MMEVGDKNTWFTECLHIVIMLNIKNYKLLLSQIAVAGVILKTGV